MSLQLLVITHVVLGLVPATTQLVAWATIKPSGKPGLTGHTLVAVFAGQFTAMIVAGAYLSSGTSLDQTVAWLSAWFLCHILMALTLIALKVAADKPTGTKPSRILTLKRFL